MPQELLTQIEEMLHEEKWTRTPVTNYNVTHIRELERLLSQAGEPNVQSRIQELCEDHLNDSKNSVIALYLSGMMNLKKQMIDDSNLVKLITLFMQNQRWALVEYISRQLLQIGESRFALRSLVDCYKHEKNEERLVEVEERLIKIDNEEADIVYSLAQRYEKENNLEKALDYYKKALHRFILKKNFNKLREIWIKLIELNPLDMEYFTQVESRVAKTFSPEKACQLLEDIYPFFVAEKDWDNAISIQLKINHHEPKSSQVRRQILECIRQKYADNPKTEEYIRNSNMQDHWKSIADALEDFKKQIAYAKGNFVFHKTWGVGRIREVHEQEYVIDFEMCRNQVMGHKMAVEALSSLERNDIRVVIATTKRDELAQKVKHDLDWTLKTIIRSFGNKADMKLIKNLLVPKVLQEREWSSWSTRARTLIRESTAFSCGKKDIFALSSQPVSQEEKLYNSFKSEKEFFKKVSIFEDFLDKIGQDSYYFNEILSEFVSYLKSAKVNEMVIASFLIIYDYLPTFVNLHVPHTFLEYFQQIEDIEAVFRALNNAKLRASFLKQIKTHVPSWIEDYIKIFPLYPASNIIDEIIAANQEESAINLIQSLIETHKEQREPFFYAAKLVIENRVPFAIRFDKEKLLITLIHDLNLTYRDMAYKKNLIENKRVNKLILNFLFKDLHLIRYIDEGSQDSVKRIYSLIKDVKELPINHSFEIRQAILKRFPSFQFDDEIPTIKASSRKGILATLKMFNQKKKELQNMIEIEVPKNSNEIAQAMALGDLKENAEYHAAKERQAFLSAAVTMLSKELGIARVVEKKDVETSKVSFGTTTSLINHIENKKEMYTLLGPWESDPSKHIISYLSPLGDKLLGAKIGQNLKFTINERTCDFTIENIMIADF